MRALLTLLVTTAVIVACHADDQYGCSEASWQLFKGHFQKQYTTVEEEANRRIIFCDNLQMIQTHNERYEHGEVTFEMGVNQFADMTREEFRRWLHGDSDGSKGSIRSRGSFRNGIIDVLTSS